MGANVLQVQFDVNINVRFKLLLQVLHSKQAKTEQCSIFIASNWLDAIAIILKPRVEKNKAWQKSFSTKGRENTIDILDI